VSHAGSAASTSPHDHQKSPGAISFAHGSSFHFALRQVKRAELEAGNILQKEVGFALPFPKLAA